MDLPFSAPLGTSVPNSPHAVCVHFPTLRDVIGYEEKDPATVGEIRAGYPRFVENPLIGMLREHLVDKHGLDGRCVYPVNSVRAGREMSEYVLSDTADWFRDGSLAVFHCEDDAEAARRCREFLQHTGCGVSSRHAEDVLVAAGVLKAPFREEMKMERGMDLVRFHLSQVFRVQRPDAILLANNGMNAFFSVFKAVSEYAEDDGRDIWVQLGWLYLDTGKILEKFTYFGTRHVVFPRIDDLDALERFLEEKGPRVAGLVLEVPTNPLMQTADLPRLRRLADAHGFVVVVDPTLASPYNIDIVPYADIVVNSLTKYAGSEGDVLMGAIVFNPSRAHTRHLLPGVVAHHEPPYTRDVARMAVQIERYPNLMKAVNMATVQVASFLEVHPKVKRVYWAYSKPFRERFEQINRWPISPGAVVSFELGGDLEAFFDACPLLKSPSFGTRFTILCPYMHLAHYDLVTTREGRETLAEAGLSPNLLRLSVGLEPPSEIIAALEKGLAAV